MSSTIIQTIIAIGVLGLSAGAFFAQFFRGKRSESGEIIDFYKKQAEEYKAILQATREEYTKKHEDLVKEVGELRGELNAEKKLREQAENILKDRNPETQEFMKLMIQAVGDQGKVNKEVVRVLSEIHTMAKAEHDRDFQITSTVTKQ